MGRFGELGMFGELGRLKKVDETGRVGKATWTPPKGVPMNSRSKGIPRIGIINSKPYHIQSSHPSPW